LIYTPHCYAFERHDVTMVVRNSFWAVEKLLARRTGTVVAVSQREAALAKSLRSEANVHYVPHAVAVGNCGPQIPRRIDDGEGLSVVGCGRIMEQKDPCWFAEFSVELRHLVPNATIRWLGGGGTEVHERVLAQAGVDVTGWIPRRRVLAELANSHVYVHSAAWEGAPLTVLEAAALGVPIIGRDIPALRSLGLSALHSAPRLAAQHLAKLARQNSLCLLRNASVEIASKHTVGLQRSALTGAYITALRNIEKVSADRAHQ
jgi:glycosyltransferase involved in cell wall biosynthesis